MSIQLPPKIRLSVVVGLLALMPAVAGCCLASAVAESAPPASAPVVSDIDYFSTRLKCWGGVQQCYIQTSHANQPTDSNRGYQFVFTVRYNVLNALSIEEDGQSVVRTDSSEPPSDRSSYFLGDPTVAAGIATSDVFVFPKRFPTSRPHLYLSRFQVIETSSNPNYQGGPQETASTEIPLTFVDSGRCQILDFSTTTPAVVKGNNTSLAWNVLNCKQIQVYRDVQPQGGAVILPTVPAPPAINIPPSALAEQDFQNTASFPATIVGAENYTLVATNALGDQVHRVLTVRVTEPGSAGGGSNQTPSGCANPQVFYLCVSCPGLSSDAPANEYSVSTSACSAAEAKTQVEQQQPTCTVSAGTMTTYTFCVECPGHSPVTQQAMGCTVDGAKKRLAQSYSASCQIRAEACP